VRNPRPDDFILWFDARLLPNGDLLATYDGIGDTPWGYGLVRMDKDSRVVWKYLQRVHHTIDIAADGRIYALTHEVHFTTVDESPDLQPPRIDGFVVVLSADGRELRKVSIIDSFLRSPYAGLLKTTLATVPGDPLHTNSVKFIGDQEASVLPFARAGQVLISVREIATLAVLDLEMQTIVWALRGPWLGQHDPDILPNGDILLFDNNGSYGPGGPSRVIEFNPNTLEIVWTYGGDDDHPLASTLRSQQQRLANGNTLITESDGGRIVEVTPDGDIVWEFVNPVRGGEAGDMIPVVSAGMRIDAQWLDASFREGLGTED
jgi:outer membrane protein assembly factor BamB